MMVSVISSNLRTIAQLFKLDLDDMFNAWNAATPLRSGMPHASAILAPESEYCLRKLILLALHPEEAQRPAVKPWDSHQNAVFLNGWVLHEKYQNLFVKHARVIEVETSHFDETRLLHFTPDAIVEFANEVMPVEIKGYKTSTFEKLDELGKPPAAAHTQVNFYLHLLELKHGLILVECKDTQEFRVWCVAYDKEMVQPQLERIYAFKGTLARVKSGSSLPSRCCTSANDRQAEKCPMRAYCFGRKD